MIQSYKIKILRSGKRKTYNKERGINRLRLNIKSFS